jgi:NTP pyrophosphatase (non-canonical NTP hydrolase)
MWTAIGYEFLGRTVTDHIRTDYPGAIPHNDPPEWADAPNRRSNPIDWPSFIRIGEAIARQIHSTAEEHGFHRVGNPPRMRSELEAVALMHSELGELTEALRSPAMPFSDHIPDFYASEEELADVIIRILEYSVQHGCRTLEAVQAKVEYNKGRPYRHGKTI